MGNFHRLEFLGRGSQTQLQVGENYFQSEISFKLLTLVTMCKFDKSRLFSET